MYLTEPVWSLSKQLDGSDCAKLFPSFTGRMCNNQSCGVTLYLASPLALHGSRDKQVETDFCVATAGLSPPVTLLNHNAMCYITDTIIPLTIEKCNS